MQCTQINRVGEQCRGQAVAGSQLCAFHAGILQGRAAGGGDDTREYRTGRQSRFPLIYRIAAGLLLVIFILELAQLIRDWFQ